jgi:hypothetical protein
MSDKFEKKYLADKRRKSYGGTKNDDSYLFRQAQQNSKLFAQIGTPQYIGMKKSRTISDPAFQR